MVVIAHQVNMVEQAREFRKIVSFFCNFFGCTEGCCEEEAILI